MNQTVYIDPLSKLSLRIEPCWQGRPLSEATGFCVLVGSDPIHVSPYLITNWHVASGRNAETNAPLNANASLPDVLKVHFHDYYQQGNRISFDIPVVADDGAPLWLEHPKGRMVDVVALPFTPTAGLGVSYLSSNVLDREQIAEPGMPVHIIGYPTFLNANGWPLWKTGHIASEPYVDYAPGLPAFLIDATTRPGMSGSPVVARIEQLRVRADHNIEIKEVHTRFLGIYSGRLGTEAEIGRVWRFTVIEDILGTRNLFGAQIHP